MKNTFKQHTYICKCGALTKEFLWDNELDKTKVKCSDCSKVLTKKNLVTKTANEAVSIRTPTKNR
jgi:hypothetical protein